MAIKLMIGVFNDEDKLISSIKALQEKGLKVHDVYMPYPVHEILKLLKRSSRLPTAGYLFGLFGAIAVLAFMYYTSVIDWPVVYGGKPFNSFPSFIVVTIILTIFIVTIMSLFTFSARSNLFPGREINVLHKGATDDKFVVVMEAGQEGGEGVEKLFREHGAVEVSEKTIEEHLN